MAATKSDLDDHGGIVTEGILVAPFVHQRIPITESEPVTFNSIITIPSVWF